MMARRGVRRLCLSSESGQDEPMGPVGDQARGDSSVDWETKQAEIQSARARRAADTSNSQELVAEVTRVHFDADPIGIN